MANEAQQSKIIDGVEVVVYQFAALRIIDGAERIDINTIATTEEEARELARRVRGISDNTITTTAAVFVHTRIVPITLVVEIPDQTPPL
jgi:hypothetical protein